MQSSVVSCSKGAKLPAHSLPSSHLLPLSLPYILPHTSPPDIASFPSYAIQRIPLSFTYTTPHRVTSHRISISPLWRSSH
ncbi:hypothetical protein PHSY_006570 [Pseudozyma hubeiensis SY62]|uniref:Uncharacterized protein n=1 Tax=Pseudozyma hubeiensis (strain SY62) TaxID=1305764 RepID=R9PC33_PSEHS|nr:hypothetical protein PHSY_006570 [Pseudozyma hubeiensis SY62]GAC98973.1 hypothetical protein PHSY_006570 [Pseudozyma hubeiensis SY62]